MISVQLPDGTSRSLDPGASSLDLAASIGPGLAKASVAAVVNGEVRDLSRFPELVFLDRFDTLVPVLFAAAMFGLGALLEGTAPGLGRDSFESLLRRTE